jgi:poly-gamma-glutamate capsule biosynthesis protein CapA/YwtB (metallophosphatase superfamily)
MRLLADTRTFVRALALLACGALAAPACRPHDPGASAPASLAAPAAPPAATDSLLRVLVAGDVLPHRPRLLPPARIGEALAPLRPLFEEADATIVNYETATGDPRNLTLKSQSIALAARPAWMAQLAGAHVTALTAANNHACDLGERGLDATIETAGSLAMPAIGVDEQDPWRARVVAEKDGHKVCAVGWTTFVNEPIAGCSESGKIAIADWRNRGLAQIDRAIAAARASGCDAVVAILHGGDEYEPQGPGPLLQARHAAFAGADAVVLHHPHVPSPVLVLATPDGRRVPIFESVGNLVSNQGESWKPAYLPVRKNNRHYISLNAWTRLGVIADLRFRWPASSPAGHGERGALEWGYHLVWTDNEHAIKRSLAMPHIDARPLDPVADSAIESKLETDHEGPLALFRDPCWMESSGSRCR